MSGQCGPTVRGTAQNPPPQSHLLLGTPHQAVEWISIYDCHLPGDPSLCSPLRWASLVVTEASLQCWLGPFSTLPLWLRSSCRRLWVLAGAAAAAVGEAAAAPGSEEFPRCQPKAPQERRGSLRAHECREAKDFSQLAPPRSCDAFFDNFFLVLSWATFQANRRWARPGPHRTERARWGGRQVAGVRRARGCQPGLGPARG